MVWLLLAACGMDAERFATAQDEALCAVETECFALYDSVEACYGTPAVDDCGSFDAAAAKDCVRALDALSEDCPSDLMEFVMPPECAEVCP